MLLGDLHGLNRLTGDRGEQKVEHVSLKEGHVELLRHRHQIRCIVPGTHTFEMRVNKHQQILERSRAFFFQIDTSLDLRSSGVCHRGSKASGCFSEGSGR